MKKNIIKFFTAVVVVCLVYACTKNTGITNQPYASYGVDTNGQLKIIFASAYTTAKNTTLIKLNGNVVSNYITFPKATPFPGGGYNTGGSNYALYLAVPKGSNTVSVILPKVGTTTDSLVFFSGTVNIPDNSPYTLHITDTAANVKSILVKNLINPVDSGYCRFRFVNLIPNLTAVDLYLNGTLMKSNIPYLGMTDTFSVAVGANAPNYINYATPTWAVRPAGSLPTSAVTASYASTTVLQNQAVLTLFSYGYAGVTGNRSPYLSGALDKNQ
ncbi:MAG: DUF4397 domain-containing protein [Bacteroidetes bacterium]|nr:DUF4397 domain-containing protein [Bacteroidota bacterium]MBS1649227.1 DUF4397 domain-containing protein [Bacteroidota bacterium]